MPRTHADKWATAALGLNATLCALPLLADLLSSWDLPTWLRWGLGVRCLASVAGAVFLPARVREWLAQTIPWLP